MRQELIDAAKEYCEAQSRIEEIEQEIDELREETFGNGSKQTEEKAKELFSELSSAEGESSNTETLSELREEESEIKERLAKLENDLLENLVTVRFPMDETIQGNKRPVEFPFSESVSQDVLDAISSALGEDIGDGEVKIQTGSIVVDTASIDDAIDAVKTEISDIRDRADANLNVPEQVQKVKNRDSKVAAILYVLHENDNKPMTKAEVEDAIGLDRGDLRGQLYYVLENDPYLEKGEDGFTLKPNGIKVIERFVNKYDVPELVSNSANTQEKGGSERTDNESEDQEEVTAYE
ncbi:hypothetical protein BRD22_11720 [Halobacteriales archaeon SW_8_68_21]|nr:MAG: hypothetical protein BRD22_11720 [Halobacteriales archaeon SW_8_68_21]